MAREKELQVARFGIDLTGGLVLVFDPIKVDFDHIDLVAEGAAEILAKDDALAKYPQDLGESAEDYSKRISLLREKENSRQEDEDGKQHAARILKKRITGDARKDALDFINLIGDYQGWKTVSEENLKGISFPLLCDFIFNCYYQYDITLERYFPKSTIGTVKEII